MGDGLSSLDPFLNTSLFDKNLHAKNIMAEYFSLKIREASAIKIGN
jgi:hypothetical protein